MSRSWCSLASYFWEKCMFELVSVDGYCCVLERMSGCKKLKRA